MVRSKFSALKAEAREKLLGNYSKVIGALLLYLIINLVLSSLVSVSPYSNSFATVFLSYGINFILELFMGVFMAGFAYQSMTVIYGDEVRISSIFHSFIENPWTALLLTLPFALLRLPFVIASNFLVQTAITGTLSELRLMAAITAAAGIFYILFALPISQVYYLMQDFPDKGAGELLRLSMRIMKGNKRRFFFLQVSFLPFLILSLVTLLIPLLWIVPYMRVTQAAFYKNLIQEKTGR